MIEQKHVLVVDDEVEMARLICTYLEKENYRTTVVHDGDEMIQMLRQQEVDVVVLDVMMPYMDGFTACAHVRQFSQVPIIMLTAKGDESDRVNGLKIGADDYIVKPFSPRELIARIEALLRRTHYMNGSGEIIFDPLRIDPDGRTVKVNGHPINLTRKEFDLLLLLAQNKEKVFTREQLHERIWGMDFAKSTLRTVDTHIKTLRLKLGPASAYISTVWGVGYKFETVPLEKYED